MCGRLVRTHRAMADTPFILPLKDASYTDTFIYLMTCAVLANMQALNSDSTLLLARR